MKRKMDPGSQASGSSTGPRDIDGYIAQFPADVQAKLQSMRTTIRQAAPEAVEAIKYRMPTFVLVENLVHFAGYARHVGFYPTPSAIAAFEPELADYVWAKGSVQFPLDRPLPHDLVRRMVEFRVNEIRTRMGAGSKARKPKPVS
jgi:uncharacterized protein YdhG (YjbR/CyaY superfamily)